MMSPVDQETTAIEKISLLFTVTKRGSVPWMQGHKGKHQGCSGGRGSRGEMWARAFTVVSAGKVRQDRVSRLRIGYFE